MKTRSTDFNHGATIDEYVVREWHSRLLNELLKGEKGPRIISSGNSMVIAEKLTLSHDPDNPMIRVIEITNGYKKYEYSDLENKNTEP